MRVDESSPLGRRWGSAARPQLGADSEDVHVDTVVTHLVDRSELWVVAPCLTGCCVRKFQNHDRNWCVFAVEHRWRTWRNHK